MKLHSIKFLFSSLTVAGFLGLAPTAMAIPATTDPGVPLPEGVSTLAVLTIALAGIAVGRKFLK